jgi:hypothetical protein
VDYSDQVSLFIKTGHSTYFNMPIETGFKHFIGAGLPGPDCFAARAVLRHMLLTVKEFVTLVSFDVFERKP